MSIILPVLAVAFAAFCVWLVVRIFNRRERWAKWTLAAGLGLPVLYLASFGPACWLGASPIGGAAGPYFSIMRRVMIVYWPLGWAAESNLGVAEPMLRWWVCFGMQSGHVVWVPADSNKTNWHAFYNR
jgi:hypothetical protein